MISIGLLGCGRIGQVHALSLARMANARRSETVRPRLGGSTRAGVSRYGLPEKRQGSFAVSGRESSAAAAVITLTREAAG